MPSNFTRPTLAELITRISTDVESKLNGVNARLRRTVEYVLSRSMAGLTHGMYGHLAWVAEQILPDQAAERYLLRWADLFGITRLEGVKAGQPATASDAITVTGTGGTVPLGAIWVRPADGATFTTDAEVGPISGTDTVNVTATEVGASFNMTTGQTLTLETPITNISSDAVVGAGGITEGTDLETLEAVLARLLAILQKPVLGGAPGDHVIWALEVPGVTRAWEFAGIDGVGNPGIGKVSLTFVRDGDGSGAAIIPDAGEVTAVQDHVQAKSPAEVITFAPTAVNYATTIQLEPNTSPVQAAVEAELADMLLRDAVPGQEVLNSRTNEAISAAEGETDHVLVSPASNKQHAFGELAIPVTPSFSAIP